MRWRASSPHSALRAAGGSTGDGGPAPIASRRYSASSLRSSATCTSIHAHCRNPLLTGILEGYNNEIKGFKRMAYGYRDDAYFFLEIRAAFPGITRSDVFY